MNKKCYHIGVNSGIKFGPKMTRSGGKALDHYCSQIIWLLKKKNDKIEYDFIPKRRKHR